MEKQSLEQLSPDFQACQLAYPSKYVSQVEYSIETKEKHRFDCRAFSMRCSLKGSLSLSRHSSFAHLYMYNRTPHFPSNPADHPFPYFVSFSGVMANVGRTNL